MEIEAELAQTIAQEVSRSTHHNINFFDTSGHCIASTDPSRIGSFHEAAFLAANRRVTVEVDDSKQYIGARNGINVPVSFQGQVVAVIGITGRKQDVKPFGDVLRRMTEILLQENFERTTRFDKSMTMANLVTLLLTDQSDPSMLSYLSSALNVDLAQDHICLVAAFDGKDHSYQDRASLLNDMNAFLERQARLLLLPSPADSHFLHPLGIHWIRARQHPAAGRPLGRPPVPSCEVLLHRHQRSLPPGRPGRGPGGELPCRLPDRLSPSLYGRGQRKQTHDRDLSDL